MRLILSTFAVLLGLNAAHAQDVDPALIEAIKLADDEDYEAAFAVIDASLDRDVVTWMKLRAGDGTFAEYSAFIAANPNWPAMSRLRARAELALEEGANAGEVIAWFGDHDPETGIGAVRLAEAYMTAGQENDAKAAIIAAWLNLRLSEDGQAAILDGFAEVVASYHAERADNLLWRWLTDEATLMLPLLDEDQAALVKARIAYIRKRDIPETIEAVPAVIATIGCLIAGSGRKPLRS